MWELIIQLGIALATMFSSVFAWRASKHAKSADSHARQVNDAVNHVHPDDDGNKLRLYDLAIRTDQRVDDLHTWRGAVDGKLEAIDGRLARVEGNGAHK